MMQAVLGNQRFDLRQIDYLVAMWGLATGQDMPSAQALAGIPVMKPADFVLCV
jgi:hypothetical protein